MNSREQSWDIRFIWESTNVPMVQLRPIFSLQDSSHRLITSNNLPKAYLRKYTYNSDLIINKWYNVNKLLIFFDTCVFTYALYEQISNGSSTVTTFILTHLHYSYDTNFYKRQIRCTIKFVWLDGRENLVSWQQYAKSVKVLTQSE